MWMEAESGGWNSLNWRPMLLTSYDSFLTAIRQALNGATPSQDRAA